MKWLDRYLLKLIQHLMKKKENAKDRTNYVKLYKSFEREMKRRRAKLSVLTWVDISMIITIYEQEIEAGNINRYGTAEDVRPYSERILERYNKIKSL